MPASVLSAIPVADALAPPPPVPVSLRAVVVNGKTCQGTKRSDGSSVHLFSLVEHRSGIPSGQVLAETTGRGIAAFAAVLDRIDVVVTADALHSQEAHARYLHRHGGGNVSIVKGHQPTLHCQ